MINHPISNQISKQLVVNENEIKPIFSNLIFTINVYCSWHTKNHHSKSIQQHIRTNHSNKETRYQKLVLFNHTNFNLPLDNQSINLIHQPEIMLSTVTRTASTIQEDGENVDLIWSFDGKKIAIIVRLY
jgi:hypothetical protein